MGKNPNCLFTILPEVVYFATFSMGVKMADVVRMIVCVAAAIVLR